MSHNQIKTALDVAHRMMFAFGVTDEEIALYLMKYLARICIKIQMIDPVQKFQDAIKHEVNP